MMMMMMTNVEYITPHKLILPNFQAKTNIGLHGQKTWWPRFSVPIGIFHYNTVDSTACLTLKCIKRSTGQSTYSEMIRSLTRVVACNRTGVVIDPTASCLVNTRYLDDGLVCVTCNAANSHFCSFTYL